MGKKKIAYGLKFGKQEGYTYLKNLGVDERIIFICIFKNKMAKCGLDSCLSG